jgi:hypothetical protein
LNSGALELINSPSGFSCALSAEMHKIRNESSNPYFISQKYSLGGMLAKDPVILTKQKPRCVVNFAA